MPFVAAAALRWWEHEALVWMGIGEMSFSFTVTSSTVIIDTFVMRSTLLHRVCERDLCRRMCMRLSTQISLDLLSF